MSARRYEFRVAGRLSERVQGAFVDMAVHDAPPETVISGEVVDDAHLHGVLAQIQDLGLHVVSVLQVPSAPEHAAPPSAPAATVPNDGGR
jgi:hypothetical protein